MHRRAEHAKIEPIWRRRIGRAADEFKQCRQIKIVRVQSAGQVRPRPRRRQAHRREAERDKAKDQKIILSASCEPAGAAILQIARHGGTVHRTIRQRTDGKHDADQKCAADQPRPLRLQQQRDVQTRQREKCEQQRDENNPVQKNISQIRRHERPRVGGKQTEFRREIVAVFPQVIQRGRLRVHRRFGTARPERGKNFFRIALPADPRTQPASDVAAAGDGREIVKMFQHAAPREALRHAERERRAADAAAGKTQRRDALVRVDAPVDGCNVDVRDGLEVFGKRGFEQQPVEAHEFRSLQFQTRHRDDFLAQARFRKFLIVIKTAARVQQFVQPRDEFRPRGCGKSFLLIRRE